ncbi:MAG: hypothetical protein U0175_34025 [Caldilineaceae bacterium]
MSNQRFRFRRASLSGRTILVTLFALLIVACSTPYPPLIHKEQSQASGVTLNGNRWQQLALPGQRWVANHQTVALAEDEEEAEAEKDGERYFEGADFVRAAPAVSNESEAGDGAGGRVDYWVEQRAFPLDTLPRAGAAIAAQEVQALMAVQAAETLPRWQNIGPAALTGSLMGSHKINVSGRVRAIVVDPRNSNVVYIGAAQGGVWKTSDGGNSWTPLTDNQASLAMGALALDPNNPDVVYAGTGEATYGQDNYYGAGILKSSNGGQSWVRLGIDAFSGVGIAKIIVDPANSNRLFVASGLVGNEGASRPPVGIYRSEDGGQSWTGVLTCSDCEGASDLVLAGNNLFAGVRGYGVFRSQDGGTQWGLLTNNIPNRQNDTLGRVMLDGSKSNSNIVYASLQLIIPNQYDGAVVVRTTDGGNNWSQVKVGPELYNFCGEQCWYSHEIAVNPANPNQILLGGQADYAGTPPNFTIRRVIVGVDATNNALTDLTPNDSPAHSLHPDMHVIAFDPQNAQIVWAGGDGGVVRSTDGGQTWQTRNNGLATMQFTGIAVDPNNDQIIQGGMQDNNKAFTVNGGTTLQWTAVDRGDGGFALIDPFASNIWYGTRFNKTFQRNDQGQNNTGDWEFYLTGIDNQDRSLFYIPIAADPSTAGTLYLGTYRLYKTTDRGGSWSPISEDLTSGTSSLSAITVAPSDPQTIYVGSSQGDMRVTTNGGASWQIITGPKLPLRFVSRIAVSATNPRVAYLVFNGFNSHTPQYPGHVFKTTDGGANWQDISSNLPDIPLLSIVLDKKKASTIYVGSDVGVFRSSNDGGSWEPFNNGMPNVAVVDLALNKAGTKLFAATHGRSVFRVSLDESVTASGSLYLPMVSRQDAPTPGKTPTPVPNTATPTATPRPGTNTPTPTATKATPQGTQLPTLPPTATDTKTPLPTATRTPGPTAQPTIQPNPAHYLDKFDSSSSGWETGSNEQCHADYVTSGSDHFFQNETLVANFLCFDISPAPARTSGVFSVRAANATANEGSLYGLVFGMDSATISANSQYYVFWIDPIAQTYALERYNRGNSAYLTTGNQGFVSSNAIFTGNNINWLRVRRQGGAIHLFVNGIWLETINDNSFPNNGFSGVVTWSGYDASSWNSYFDDFEVNQIAKVYDEGYTNDSSGWSVGGGDETCQSVYTSGLYRTAVQPDFICVYRGPARAQVNGRFEVDARRDDSFYQTAYGLLLGEDGNFTSYYVFAILPDTQSYALLKYIDGQGWFGITWDNLTDTPWLNSDAIFSGSNQNHLVVERDWASFRLIVNDQVLGVFYDSQPLEGGYYGVFNWSSQFETAIAEFDNYKVTAFDPPLDVTVVAAESGKSAAGKPPTAVQKVK